MQLSAYSSQSNAKSKPFKREQDFWSIQERAKYLGLSIYYNGELILQPQQLVPINASKLSFLPATVTRNGMVRYLARSCTGVLEFMLIQQRI